MIAKARTEIAHTVKIARMARRPMYASMGRGPGHRLSRRRPGRGGRLVLVVERRRARDAGGLAVRAVVLARRDIAHVVLHHAHAHGGRALSDHTDDVDLLGGEPPDVLAELDPLLLRHAEGLLPLLHQFLHPRLPLLSP